MTGYSEVITVRWQTGKVRHCERDVPGQGSRRTYATSRPANGMRLPDSVKNGPLSNSDDFAGVVYVDRDGARELWQPGHEHYVAGNNHDEPCTRRERCVGYT
jgi:hypothetical protein